jgi:hypothetical protein
MDDGEQPIDPSALRASDAERERTATLLREHTATGRLTPEELDERLDVAYAARTVGELDALVHDLPASADAAGRRTPPARSAAREAARSRLLHAIGLAVLVSAAATVIWLATGADGVFWPRWVILVSALRVAFAAWGELGPAGGGRAEETRLGRGGAPPRAPLPPPPPRLPRERGDER